MKLTCVRRLDETDDPAASCKRLKLVNLAQGGATTPSLIEAQLPAAIALLEKRNGDHRRRNDVKLVTLHIGGNDVAAPIPPSCSVQIDAACVAVFTGGLVACGDGSGSPQPGGGHALAHDEQCCDEVARSSAIFVEPRLGGVLGDIDATNASVVLGPLR